MDSLDIRILRDILESQATSPLDASVRKSLSSVARRLKVDENTVKNRIERLRRSGFLRGWWVCVNPNLVGQRMAQVWLDVRSASTKRALIEKLSLLPGVAVIRDLYGPSLSLVIFYEDERSRKKTFDLISSIAGPSTLTYVDEPFPASSLVFSRTDLKILGILQKEPQMPYAEIAGELGLSSRTVKRRIARLAEGNALYLVAELNPKFLSGGIVCGLLVFHDERGNKSAAERNIVSHLGDQLLFADLDNPHHGYFALIIENIALAEPILNWALAQAGVSNGRIDVVQEVISLYGVYEEQLEKLERNVTQASQSKPLRAS